jgi:histone-lysine N-methyltransferase SETMAR
MLAVAWNTTGFLVIVALAKGIKFDTNYHVAEILERTSESRNGNGIKCWRRLTVDPDNARPYTTKSSLAFLEANEMIKGPHPPYSPDLAPSDSFLFGHVKRLLRGWVFTTAGGMH